MRLTVADKAGVLSKISAIFGRYGISIVEMIQKANENGQATLILVTHETKELSVRNAVSKINALDEIAKVESILRVVA